MYLSLNLWEIVGQKNNNILSSKVRCQVAECQRASLHSRFYTLHINHFGLCRNFKIILQPIL